MEPNKMAYFTIKFFNESILFLNFFIFYLFHFFVFIVSIKLNLKILYIFIQL
jgi:hypothetical protein